MDRSKGFSLVELAVVMMIVALLLAAALIPFSTQIDLRSQADTQRTLDSIKEAVIGFAQANGRLPCPANGTAPPGAVGTGSEALSGTIPNTTCTNAFGVVPWATLGVPETDAWGRRFSYWVSPIFADGVGPPTATFNNTFPALQNPTCTPAPAPTQSSFALCSLGSFTVNTRNEATHATSAVGTVLAAVIISHGKNGQGAYVSQGGPALPAPVGADEISNANHAPAANTFISRVQTKAASGCNDAAPAAAGSPPLCEFDDLVAMITPNVLIARMVSAGRLP